MSPVMNWGLVKTHWLRVLAVLLALVVVGLGAAVYAAERDTRPRAQVGDVFDEPHPEPKITHSGTAYLPWTELEVGFDDPTDELPEQGYDSDANVRAPEDGSFVRVRVESGETKPTVATRSAPAPDVDIVLRADGKDYSLNQSTEFVPDFFQDVEGDRWVAVEGEPEDLEVRITVDGKTQVVDADGSDQGRARALAKVPTNQQLYNTESVGCGKFRFRSNDGLRPENPDFWECKVGTGLRTPYVAGVGWAEDGEEFYVLSVELPPELWLATSGDSTIDRVTTTSWSATLAGDRPVRPMESGGVRPADFFYPNQLIFSVPEGAQVGDLLIRADARVTLTDPFEPQPAKKATIEWTVPGEKLP